MLFLIITENNFLLFRIDPYQVGVDQIRKLLLFHSNHVELKLYMRLYLHVHHPLLLDKYDLDKNPYYQYILDQHENEILY